MYSLRIASGIRISTGRPSQKLTMNGTDETPTKRPIRRRTSTIRRKYGRSAPSNKGKKTSGAQGNQNSPSEWLLYRRMWAMFHGQPRIAAGPSQHGQSSQSQCNNNNIGSSLYQQLCVMATGKVSVRGRMVNTRTGGSTKRRHRKLVRQMRKKYSNDVTNSHFQRSKAKRSTTETTALHSKRGKGVPITYSSKRSDTGPVPARCWPASAQDRPGADLVTDVHWDEDQANSVTNEVLCDTSERPSKTNQLASSSAYSSIGWAIVGSTLTEPISFAGLATLSKSDVKQNATLCRSLSRSLSRTASFRHVAPATKLRKRSIECHASDWLVLQRSSKTLCQLAQPEFESTENDELSGYSTPEQSPNKSAHSSWSISGALSTMVSRSPRRSPASSTWYIDLPTSSEPLDGASSNSEQEQESQTTSQPAAAQDQILTTPQRSKPNKWRIYRRKSKNTTSQNAEASVESPSLQRRRTVSGSSEQSPVSGGHRQLDKSASVSDLLSESPSLSSQRRWPSQWKLVRKISNMLSSEHEQQAPPGGTKPVYHSPDSERFYAALAADLEESNMSRNRAMTIGYDPRPSPPAKTDATRSKSVDHNVKECVKLIRQLSITMEDTVENPNTHVTEQDQHAVRLLKRMSVALEETDGMSSEQGHTNNTLQYSNDTEPVKGHKGSLRRQQAVVLGDDELSGISVDGDSLGAGKPKRRRSPRPKDWLIYKRMTGMFHKKTSRECRRCSEDAASECVCSVNGIAISDQGSTDSYHSAAQHHSSSSVINGSAKSAEEFDFSEPDDVTLAPSSTFTSPVTAVSQDPTALSCDDNDVSPSQKHQRRSKLKNWFIYRKISATLQGISPKSRHRLTYSSTVKDSGETSPGIPVVEDQFHDFYLNGKSPVSQTLTRRISRKPSINRQRSERGSRRKSVKRNRALKWSTYQRMYSRIDKKLRGSERPNKEGAFPLHYKCLQFTNEGHDVSYKVFVVGDTGVGKTAMMQNINDQPFISVKIPSQGVDYVDRIFHVDGARIHLAIWNLPGGDAAQALTREQHRSAKGILLVFDVTRRATYKRLGDWLNSIHKEKFKNVPVLVVGNKCDSDGRDGRVARAVTTEEGRKISSQYSCDGFYETSAKRGINIDHAFGELAYSITSIQHPHLMDSMMSVEAYSEKYSQMPDSCCDTACALQQRQKTSSNPAASQTNPV